MFPHDFLPCRRRGGLVGVGSNQSGWDRVDPSPRDHQLMHVRNLSIKWPRSEGQAMATWRRKNHPIIIKFRSSDRDLTASSEAAWTDLAHRIFITIRPSDGGRHTTKNSDRSPIVTRSRRDRSSIGLRLNLLSSRNHSKLRRWRLTEIQAHDRRLIMARSWPDRGPIVPRSGLVLKRNWSKFYAES